MFIAKPTRRGHTLSDWITYNIEKKAKVKDLNHWGVHVVLIKESKLNRTYRSHKQSWQGIFVHELLKDNSKNLLSVDRFLRKTQTHSYNMKTLTDILENLFTFDQLKSRSCIILRNLKTNTCGVVITTLAFQAGRPGVQSLLGPLLKVFK